ncbi:MAG: beta-ketoacyl synthase chain length factor [Burkholderiaceae bacterium]
MSRLNVGIAGVAVLGPGLPDWEQGAALLREPARWVSAPTVVHSPARLAPTERRRAGPGIKASIAVADAACAMAGVDAAVPATVFAASSADPAICHAICEALATPERLVSPTRFTNSVHNASAGYWHIAVHSMQPSTSLAAYDATFAAGLLEAAAQCMASGAPVLLVACDVPFPEPLHALRPMPDVFACALLLQPGAGHWRLAIEPSAGESATRLDHEGLSALRRAVPAARALPLLQAMARSGAQRIVLDDEHGFALALQVEPR